jgi:hypothetical protein
MSQPDSATAETTLVAGVFGDHAAAEPAVAKLKEMGAGLAQAGVSGILTVAKQADGTIDTRAVALPGVETSGDALAERTRAALEKLAGVRHAGDPAAAELGRALAPGAVAVGVFLPADRAQVVTIGMQNPGAQVLSDDELRRIGARPNSSSVSSARSQSTTIDTAGVKDGGEAEAGGGEHAPGFAHLVVLRRRR